MDVLERTRIAHLEKAMAALEEARELDEDASPCLLAVIEAVDQLCQAMNVPRGGVS